MILMSSQGGKSLMHKETEGDLIPGAMQDWEEKRL